MLQTLSWHFNRVADTGGAAATNKPSPAVLQDWMGGGGVWRLTCGSAEDNPGLQKDQGRKMYEETPRG